MIDIFITAVLIVLATLLANVVGKTTAVRLGLGHRATRNMVILSQAIAAGFGAMLVPSLFQHVLQILGLSNWTIVDEQIRYVVNPWLVFALGLVAISVGQAAGINHVLAEGWPDLSRLRPRRRRPTMTGAAAAPAGKSAYGLDEFNDDDLSARIDAVTQQAAGTDYSEIDQLLGEATI